MFGAGKIMKKCPWFSWIRCIYIVEKGPSKTSSFGLRGQKAPKVFVQQSLSEIDASLNLSNKINIITKQINHN